jgi:hypothetical protein
MEFPPHAAAPGDPLAHAAVAVNALNALAQTSAAHVLR